jgi:hypothetical protein
MSATVGEAFALTAADYDRARRQSVPLTNQAKGAVFANVHAALRAAGVFTNAEQVQQPSSTILRSACKVREPQQ